MSDKTKQHDVLGGAPATRHGDDFDEAASFDEAGRLVFRTTPTGASAGTVIFAPSLFAEFQRNYRREVLLARAVAAAGLATIRFHYRGTGNSVGAETVPTLDTMAEDILEVAEEYGDGQVAVVATRVAALAAARARNKVDIPVALWEPVIDGRRWVEEVVKACLAREVAAGGEVTADEIRGRWDTHGVVYAIGEAVPAAIVEQIAGEQLLDAMGGTAEIQLIQMARNDRIRPAMERLRAGFADRGVAADVLPIVGHQVWWLNLGGDQFDPIEQEPATSALSAGVVDWLRRTLR